MEPDHIRAKVRDLGSTSRPPARTPGRRWPWFVGVATVVVPAVVVNIQPLLRSDADAVKNAGTVRTAASAGLPAHESHPSAAPLRATGFVVPRHSAVVSSEVTGRIVEVAVEEGDKVAAGSIVARLDDTATRADLALARARAAAIASRDGELRVEQALAEEERDSAARLAASGFISETARSRLHGKVHSIIERRKTLSAELEAARAEMARVHAQLSKHTIVAPIAGVVVSRSRRSVRSCGPRQVPRAAAS